MEYMEYSEFVKKHVSALVDLYGVRGTSKIYNMDPAWISKMARGTGRLPKPETFNKMFGTHIVVKKLVITEDDTEES